MLSYVLSLPMMGDCIFFSSLGGAGQSLAEKLCFSSSHITGLVASCFHSGLSFLICKMAIMRSTFRVCGGAFIEEMSSA